ncbi:MAG TPA: glycine cleavage T C-terminal barrel domain-containing protein [Bryobacteraceae bacterium]|nr:glycine cleavage T C-terminal barrel domain-containing protein [Bryobacteraceae bacterium]
MKTAMNEQAYTALRSTAAYIDLPARGSIRVSGEDRARLLHAMSTSHVQELQPGTGCYAFFLTSQGRIVADSNIYCMSDYFLLDTEATSKDRLKEHLEKYIIADDAWLTDFTADSAVLTVEGPEAEKALNSLGAPVAHLPYTIAEWGHCFVAHWSYTGSPGYTLIMPVEERESVQGKLAAAGIPEAAPEVADTVRIENRKPRYGIDFSDANIPHETQILGAIHPNKGCYLGQEIVERVRSRGQVNRLLCSLEVSGSTAPARGTKVQLDSKEVGEITSAAYSPALGHSVAFGLLRAEAMTQPLRVGDGITARVRQAAKPV